MYVFYLGMTLFFDRISIFFARMTSFFAGISIFFDRMNTFFDGMSELYERIKERLGFLARNARKKNRFIQEFL